MKVTIESISPIQKKLSVEIPPERVTQEIERSYRAVQNNARLKGFRAGKVPRPLLERHFGEQIAAEVSSLLVEESYGRALAEHAIPAVSRPQIVAEKLIIGQPFRYAATIEVRPEVVIKDYEGIEVERKVRKVGEEEVARTLDRLAESFSQLRPITERETVALGDVVTLDYSAFQRGKPVPGMQGKNRMVELKQGTAPPGFVEHLVGARRGETVQFSVSLAEHVTLGQGALTTFRVTVREIARKEKPPLDDEFAKDHGECATLAELRAKVLENLQQAANRQADRQLEDALISKILERNPFEVPSSLVQDQLQRLLAESGVQQPGDVTALPETVRDDLTRRARKQVQTIFVLDAIARQAGLTVSEEELHRRIDEILSTVSVEHRPRLEALYAQPESRETLQDRLLREKALRFLVDKAKITTIEEEDVAGGEEKG